MVKGNCPTCCCDLNDSNNVVVTEESKIFKGHNVYVMCKHCGLVMVYNTTRELLYDLDKFKEDEDVLVEIKELLEKQCSISEITCNGDCESCMKNCENKTIEEHYEVNEDGEISKQGCIARFYYNDIYDINDPNKTPVENFLAKLPPEFSADCLHISV